MADPSHLPPSFTMISAAATSGPVLSARATSGPDTKAFIARFKVMHGKAYDPEKNPNGVVSLAIAENCLIEDEIMQLCREAMHKQFQVSDLSLGDDLWASKRLNGALAGFINKYFKPAELLIPEQLVCGSGVSPLMDQVFHAIADEGDAALVQAPYYTGFDRDLVTGRSRIHLEQVHSSDPFEVSCVDGYRAAYDRCIAQGRKVRAIILCSPHNPLGRVYPRQTLLELARFCEEYNLHLVSDEIYALSVYVNDRDPDAPEFTSILSLDVAKELGIPFDKSRVHCVYGISKDFGSNGLRLGVLISQHNPELLGLLANVSKVMKVSSAADAIWSYILLNPDIHGPLLRASRERLGSAHAKVRNWLEKRGFEVFVSNAGNFVWANFGKRLEFSDAAGEAALIQKLMDGGVYVAGGASYHSASPGWVRLTFSVRPSLLDLGLERLDRALPL